MDDRNGRSCKRPTTPEGVMAVVHASRNDTGQVYVRAMHDGRNDRMKWIPRICHLVACCLNEIGDGC